jgi:hypothetical protein
VAFKITIQQLQNLKSLDLSILNQNNVLISQIGSYDLKTHPSGFYYIETSANEKKTVLGNDVFFTHIINSATYNSSWSIRLEYKSKSNIVKSILNSITK